MRPSVLMVAQLDFKSNHAMHGFEEIEKAKESFVKRVNLCDIKEAKS